MAPFEIYVFLFSFIVIIGSLEKQSTACYYRMPEITPWSASVTISKGFFIFTSSRLVIFKAFPLIPSGVNWRMNIKARRNVWMLKQCAMWWRGQRLAVDCVFLTHCKTTKTKKPTKNRCFPERIKRHEVHRRLTVNKNKKIHQKQYETGLLVLGWK